LVKTAFVVSNEDESSEFDMQWHIATLIGHDKGWGGEERKLKDEILTPSKSEGSGWPIKSTPPLIPPQWGNLKMVFSGKTLMPISWYQVRMKAQNSTYHGMAGRYIN